jgi:hypothetical protein
MLLRFNTLLEAGGLDPEKVYLLRHEDGRLPPGRLFSAWLSERSSFESYQSQKWTNRFKERSVLASFVVGPDGGTLFVGLYDVVRLSRSSESFDDPLLGQMDPEDRAIHETQHSDRLEEFEGKLVIDWGPGRNFRQIASQQNKTIVEIRPGLKEPPFPRYINFIHRLGDLPSIWPIWQARLKESKGVYLLAFDDGTQYVGSASGGLGFWQRWSDYLRNGHGGNQVLIRDQRDARTATVSILEISGSADTDDEIIGREMLWQRKLGTRAKRLDNERVVVP